MSEQEPKIGDKVLCFDHNIYYDSYRDKTWRDVWYISVITNIYSEGEDTPLGNDIQYELTKETGEGKNYFVGGSPKTYYPRNYLTKLRLQPLGFDSEGKTNLWIIPFALDYLHNSK